MKQFELSSALLDWYAQNARPLPWRRQKDAYAIWVSEVMLQQTRVETVIPYFERWMERLPHLSSLAAASQQEVLSLWEGLGYYSRARNLHRAAQIVMESMGGQLPPDEARLRTLPGIGEYIAAAIASIAFGREVIALDGNLRRVLSRFYDIAEDLDSPAGKSRLSACLQTINVRGKAGDFNQAMMDLGATICTPKAPRCALCPLRPGCRAFAAGTQEQRPLRRHRQELPHLLVTAAVIFRDHHVLITQRPQKGLLGGLWEFPGGKVQSGEDLQSGLKRELREELGVEVTICQELGAFRHRYTHFRVTLHAFHCALLPGCEPRALQVADLKWVLIAQLGEFPMGKIDRMISTRLITGSAPGC